jgi:cyclase
MLRPRLIPCLLIHKGGLVKTRGFSEPKYVGDPINAVKIFNEKEADELLVLDIDATVTRAEPNYGLIAKLAAECRMPLCYGGGVASAEQASRIIDLGVEKVSLSAAALADPEVVTRTAAMVGRQSVVGVVDVRKRPGMLSLGYEVLTHNARRLHSADPMAVVKSLEAAGVGEIVLNSIDRDGCMNGYDLELARRVKAEVRVPLTVLGGAGSTDDMSALLRECGVVGLAAGSLFVFKGRFRAVLINYPTFAQREELLSHVHR